MASATPTPSPSPDAGSLAALVRPVPERMRLFHSQTATNYVVSCALGPALAWNTWVPWESSDATTLWFPFLASQGQAFTVLWDDAQGSGTYGADIVVGLYRADQVTRLAGWPADLDSAYPLGQGITPDFTSVVWLAVRPSGGDTAKAGSFALKLTSTTMTNDRQSFAWYLDGTLVTGASSWSYSPTISSLASGRHTITAVASRDGKSWSESWRFTK